MSEQTILHGQMSSVDENGNVTVLYQETDATVVNIDRNDNASVIPSDADTLQKLLNKLGTLAFKSNIESADLSLDFIADNYTIETEGYALDARRGKDLNDRLENIEDSEVLVLGIDTEDTDIIVPESEINDNVTSPELTWSSSKIQNVIDNITRDETPINFYVTLVEGAGGVWTTQQTVTEIDEAYHQNRPIWVIASGILLPLRQRVDAGTWIFSGYTDSQAFDITITASGVTFTYQTVNAIAGLETEYDETTETVIIK